MHHKLVGWFAAALLVLTMASPAAAQNSEHHVKMTLDPVGGSGVAGRVQLTLLPHGGTHIVVVASGLQRGGEYISLYYDNHECALEPYSAEDVIGGRYTANAAGIGQTTGVADDDLDEINSVSVRRASDFTLLACADVHPGA